jgi:threonine dehydratase
LRSEWLSQLAGSEVYLKCENLQLTGSFKVRGAIAALSLLDEDQRSAGVVASSAGNHGLGLAFAARVFDVPCTIVVPRSIRAAKEEGIQALGARIVMSPHDGYDHTQAWTLDRLGELGGIFISPFEHPAVIAGNGGTTMLEIVEDAPPFDAAVIPCGGGGCAIGAGIVAEARSPATRIIGVNTDASPGLWLSRRDGRPHLTVDSEPTIAEGLEGGVSELTFELSKRYIDDVVMAREETIRCAVLEVGRREHMIVEGSGAAAVAALLDHRLPTTGRSCLFLTGANIDWTLLTSLS